MFLARKFRRHLYRFTLINPRQKCTMKYAKNLLAISLVPLHTYTHTHTHTHTFQITPAASTEQQ